MKAWRFNETEKAYAKYYLKRNVRLIVVSMIMLFLMMNQDLFTGIAIRYIISMFIRDNAFYSNVSYNSNALYLLAFAVAALAFLLTLFQFRFLMKKASSDMYMSLPIARNRLFYIQYILGVFLLVGMSSTIFILLGMLNPNQSMFLVVLAGFCIIEVIGILLYTFYTWICMQCSTMFDTIVVMILYTFLPILLITTIRAFYSLLMDSILISSYLGISSESSDFLWVLNNFISLPWLMRSGLIILGDLMNGDAYQGLSNMITGGYLTALISWCLIGIYLFTSGRQRFIQRKSESSEEKTNSFLTYPILVPMFVISILLICGVSKDSLIWVVLVFFVYMGTYFFVQRKISFHWKMVVQYLAIVIAIGSIQWIVIETHMFGSVQEIPNKEEIKWMELQVSQTEFQTGDELGDQEYGESYITYNYASRLLKDPDLVDELLNDHEVILPYAKKTEFKDAYSIIYRYKMLDGSEVIRYYGFTGENAQFAKQLLDRWQKDRIVEFDGPGNYDDTGEYDEVVEDE